MQASAARAMAVTRTLGWPLAAMAVAAAGCSVTEFSHYEPTVVPLKTATVYEAQLAAAPRPDASTVLYAEPLGVREGYGGLVVDLLLRGESLRDRLPAGEVWAMEPVPLLAVSVSRHAGRVEAAGPPKKVVDTRELSPLGTIVDHADSLFISVIDVPGEVPTRIVSIAVVPLVSITRGGDCYVRVLPDLPSESKMTAWLPRGTRIVAPERMLTVK